MTKNYFTEAQAVELAKANQVGDSHGYFAVNYSGQIHDLCNAGLLDAAARFTNAIRCTERTNAMRLTKDVIRAAPEYCTILERF